MLIAIGMKVDNFVSCQFLNYSWSLITLHIYSVFVKLKYVCVVINAIVWKSAKYYIYAGVKPGQLIVCWPDYIMLVVRVSTLLIIGIPCAQTQCEINPLRGNPFHLPIPTRRTFESFASVENFCASLLAERIYRKPKPPHPGL